MGWSTELFCNISFNREAFNSKYEVEQKIEELERCLKVSKTRIRDLVIMTDPEKYCPENYDSWIWVDSEFEDNMECIEDYITELYKLRTLLDNWDNCHNKDGLAINPPKEITWKTAFLDGDFVKTVKNPNINE